MKSQGMKPETILAQGNMQQAIGSASRAADKTTPFTPKRRREDGTMDFSLFFFSGDGSTMELNKYGMLMECVKFADRHGFPAVWTPERHFEDFGGLYPNPSVLSAALAAVTETIEVRAGSVVLPLHHPIRFTEEWSVVDNLSNGRVSVSFATGWHPADFLLAPVQSPDYYESRKAEMFRSIETVQALWRGDAVPFTDMFGTVREIRTLPRPIQKQLTVWIATNGSEESYRHAAEIGANILTGIIGNSFGQLEEKISRYREMLAANGYDPGSRKVAVMLHTCLGDSNEEVRRMVEQPLKEYLKTFIRQQKNFSESYDAMTAADLDVIVSKAFEAYFEFSALFGTKEKCYKLLQTYRDIDVQEIACLMDFGVDQHTVMTTMRHLSELRQTIARTKELKI